MKINKNKAYKTEIKHTYKDGIFRMLFDDKNELLDLYNALSGQNYPPDTRIQIVTLDNAIFGDLKNDLAFLVENKLIILIDHQSTYCPNMPLRMLGYIVKEYETLLFSNEIYSKRLIQIPTPEFHVFYNGTEERPLMEKMKLSNAFIEKYDTLSLELVVNVININHEKGAEILKRCKTLSEYSQFIHIFRQQYVELGDKQAAAKMCIEICMNQGILVDFLKRNGGDILSFLFDALTREECEAIREEDGYIRGLEEGRTEGEASGVIKSQHTIARKMLHKGLDHALIMEMTGLSKEDLDQLS